jgi:hypothetical protein
MGQVLKKLPPMENVLAAAAGTAIMSKIPQGYIYDALILKFGGTLVASKVSELRLTLGGKVIWRGTGAHIDSMNKYYSLTNSATYLPLHFQDRQAKTVAGRRVGSIDTKNFSYNDFSLEVDLDGTQTGATIDVLGLIGGPKPDPGTGPMFRALVKSTNSPSSAAQYNITVPTGSQQGNLVRAVFAYHSTITSFELKKDAVNIVDNRVIADLQFLENEVLRTTQSGQFVYDPMIDGDQGDCLDVRRYDAAGKSVGLAAMEWLFTVSGSGLITFYSDLYCTIGSF